MKLVSNSNHIIISVYISESLSIDTPAQARQRGSRSHETGCEAPIQAHGERHPQSAKRSTIHTPNHNSLDNVTPQRRRGKGVAEALRLDAKRQSRLMARGIPKAPSGLQSTPRLTTLSIIKLKKQYTCNHCLPSSSYKYGLSLTNKKASYSRTIAGHFY